MKTECEKLCDALWSGKNHIKLDVSSTVNDIDNTVSVRLYMLLRGINNDTYNTLLEPYDNGYYKRSDGKSSPFGFFKIEHAQNILGFKKDIVSVRHDFDYYLGLDRKEADSRYKELQLELGHYKWVVKIEYFVLRALGWKAWNSHRDKRDSIEGYGKIEHIVNLPIYRAKDKQVNKSFEK